MTQVRLEHATPQSQVKHSTTEPLGSLRTFNGTSPNSADPDQMPHKIVSVIRVSIVCLQNVLLKFKERAKFTKG